jgi:hypothetical protein
MRRIAALVVGVCWAAGLLAAEPKDPKTLDVPAEKTAAAKDLIAKLDDDDILVRDKLTAELRATGRDALPALLEAEKAKLPKRVLDRVAEVLPAARKEDFNARYPLFLSDRDCKFDHDLSGWNDLKAAVKDTKESRQLFADILRDEACREMLLQAFDTTDAGRKAFEKRWDAKRNEWIAEFRAARRLGGIQAKEDEPLDWAFAISRRTTSRSTGPWPRCLPNCTTTETTRAVSACRWSTVTCSRTRANWRWKRRASTARWCGSSPATGWTSRRSQSAFERRSIWPTC